MTPQRFSLHRSVHEICRQLRVANKNSIVVQLCTYASWGLYRYAAYGATGNNYVVCVKFINKWAKTRNTTKLYILLSLIESIKPSSAEGWADVANGYQIAYHVGARGELPTYASRVTAAQLQKRQGPREALAHRDSSPHYRAATERYRRQDATTERNIRLQIYSKTVLHCEFTGVWLYSFIYIYSTVASMFYVVWYVFSCVMVPWSLCSDGVLFSGIYVF